MNYPLQMNFKILGIAPQIFVTDANGSSVFYVRQKLFKLKEAVRVYRDKSREDLKYEIKADRILDFSAKYTFTDQNGSTVGAVGRKGCVPSFAPPTTSTMGRIKLWYSKRKRSGNDSWKAF